MRTRSTRELLTEHKAVQASLASGESLMWTSRGKIVAQLTPPPAAKAEKTERPDFVARALRIGALNEGSKSAGQWISEDRGQ